MVKFIYFLTICMLFVLCLIASIVIVEAFKAFGALGGMFTVFFTLLITTNVLISTVDRGGE